MSTEYKADGLRVAPSISDMDGNEWLGRDENEAIALAAALNGDMSLLKGYIQEHGPRR